MKKITSIFIVFIMSMQLTGCFNLSVADANEEVVLVKQPYIFGIGGISNKPVTNGSAWVAWSTKEITYNVSPISYEVSFNDVISSDNVPIDLSANAVISINRGQSPQLHKESGVNWYRSKVSHQFNMLTRNFVRDNKHKDLMNDRKTIEKGQEILKKELSSYLKEEGLQVTLHNVILGKANPPKELLVQISETSAQLERIQTETNRENAEKSRKNAEKAKADADKAYKDKMGFTANEYLSLRQLELEKEKLMVVKDKEDVTIIMNSGGGAVGTFKVKQSN